MRVRSCGTPPASGSWSATPDHQGPRAPRHRRTVHGAGGREGRGAGPHKDYVLLDCTHLGAEVLETKLPDITEFARTYLGVDPVFEPVPVMPTAHYAMGGIPTNVNAEVLRDNTTVVPGSTPPASARASRCTGRTASARTRCSTSTCSASGPAATRSSTSRAPTSRRSPTTWPAPCAACSSSP